MGKEEILRRLSCKIYESGLVDECMFPWDSADRLAELMVNELEAMRAEEVQPGSDKAMSAFIPVGTLSSAYWDAMRLGWIKQVPGPIQYSSVCDDS